MPLPEGVTPISPMEALKPQNLPEGVTPLSNGEVTLNDVAVSVGQSFNKGMVANTLGAPVDLANFLLFGLGGPEPVGGSQFIQRGMSVLGMAPRVGEDVPLPFLGRIVEETGTAAGALLPFGMAARAGVATKGVLSPIFNAFRNSPGFFSLEELLLGTTAGFGAAIAQKAFPDDATAEMIGQLVGSFTGIPSITLSKAALRGARRSLRPLTPGGAETEAARRIQELVPDPEVAARDLRRLAGRPSAEGLPPAAITEEPGLLRLEQAVVASSAELTGEFAKTVDAVTAGIARDMAGLGAEDAVSVTTDLLQQRRQYISDLLKARNSNALNLAKQRVDDLNIPDPVRRRTEVNRIVREEVESALVDAGKQEDDLWAVVPKNIEGETSATIETFEDITQRRGKTADPEDIPGYVRRFLDQKIDPKTGEPTNPDAFADSEKVGDLIELRSRMLGDIRSERARPEANRRKIGILSDLQGAILEDLENVADPMLQEARAFSLGLNETYRRGPVGKMLGYTLRGPTTAPELSLERAIGGGGPAADVELQAILKASKNSPETRQSIEEYMKIKFLEQATDRNGIVAPAAAERFRRRNAKILQEFPGLDRNFSDAASAQDIADATARTTAAREKSLFDKTKSAAALYLDGPPGQEIARVLKGRNPEAGLKRLVNSAAKDKTGTAMRGLRAQYVEQVFGRAEMQSFTEQGGRGSIVKGLRSLENNIKTFGPMAKSAGLFTDQEARRLTVIGERARKMANALAQGRTLSEVVESTPDALVDTMARIFGARVGALTGAGTTGAPLVLAGRGSRLARSVTNVIPLKRVRDMLTLAVQDVSVMETLLTKITPKNAKEIRRQLRGHLLNLQSPFDEGPPATDQESFGRLLIDPSLGP